MTRALPLGVLLAAASLGAQTYITISGSGGIAGESYSTAISTDSNGELSAELDLAFRIEYLAVGGGGAGGTAGGSGGENTWGAGGGGAGGVISGLVDLPEWNADAYAESLVGVIVGAGGTAAAYSAGSTSTGNSGTDSRIVLFNYDVLEALGGGGGAGSNNSSTGGVGRSGGSGGGGGGDGLKSGGAGTDGQGYAGGTSRSSATNRAAGGGGGGAGGVGQIGGPPNGHNSGVGGNGGVGITSTITGTSVYYGGGGAGGGRDTNGGATSAGGTGGLGGGGNGSGQGNATSGTDGLGGGGGGSGADGKGGDGGDGVVIFRYKGEAAGTGGNVAAGTGTAAGYTIHTFSTAGEDVLDLSTTDLDARLGATVLSTITGTGSLDVRTNGTIVYVGNASHTGGTNVHRGTFQFGNGNVHGSGSLGSSAVTVAEGATFAINKTTALVSLYNNFSGAGTFVKMGVNQVTLEGDFSGLSGSIEIENGVLNLANANGTSYAVAAGTSGAGALTKSSDGTVILSGNLAHTGGTTVSRGKLVINGIHDGAITVLKGAGAGILGGSGTITGDTTIFGFHTPGNSPGIQTFEGNLTYESGSFLQWELGAQTTVNSPLAFDQIVVGGDLTFAGPTNLYFNFSSWAESTVDWTDAFWNSSRSWLLIDVAGTTTGIENLSIYSAALTGNWVDSNGVAFATALEGAGFSISQVGSDVYLNYSAVPEPSTYGLILGGLALAGAALRRRKAKQA